MNVLMEVRPKYDALFQNRPITLHHKDAYHLDATLGLFYDTVTGGKKVDFYSPAFLLLRLPGVRRAILELTANDEWALKLFNSFRDFVVIPKDLTYDPSMGYDLTLSPMWSRRRNWRKKTNRIENLRIFDDHYNKAEEYLEYLNTVEIKLYVMDSIVAYCLDSRGGMLAV